MRFAAWAGLAVALLAASDPAAATEVRIFLAQTQGAFLTGTMEGIAVDSLGRIRLADRAERLASPTEPFLLCAASHPDGWIAGTGNAGRVLKIDRGGAVHEIFAAPEPEIFAVVVDADGTVFAASSPRGKIYRIPPGGEAEVFFDPGEIYVWALARAADGALLAATGTEGRLWRIEGPGRGGVVFDSDEAHLRSLLVQAGGEVLAGTAGEGLVLQLTPAAGGWRARTLHDAVEPEVVALAAGEGGEVFVATAASEASRVSLSDRISAAPDEEGAEEAGGEVTIVGEDGEAPVLGSRPASFSGPRSQVLRLHPSGLVETLARLDTETVYALAWQRGRLWVATGQEGKIYSWEGSYLVLEKDVDEAQVVALLPDGSGSDGPAFATTNGAALYRFVGGSERQGVYTSPALDAGQVSRFGTLRWRGEAPPGTGVEFSFRSGVSSEPDRTWSEWAPWRPGLAPAGAGGAGDGGEVAVEGVPRARFAQWRARLSGDRGATPRLFAVELSYRQENLRPRIDRLTVMDPGEILVPSNFNSGNQAYEPVGPNRDGIFTTLKEATDGEPRTKTLWKKGWRTLRWRGVDDNGDRLLYDLSFRPAAGEGSWMPVAEGLTADSYGFDATALPDGLYRFRLAASDAQANDAGQGLVVERVSEPVLIDHTHPVLLSASAHDGTLEAAIEDALSPLRRAEVSFDAARWLPAGTADGLLDARRETLRIAVPPGTRLVLLRLMDAAYNTVTFDLSAQAGLGGGGAPR